MLVNLKRILLAATTFILVIPAGSVLAVPTSYKPSETGIDISWPNCKAINYVTQIQPAFGIVGVTGGLDFTPNNCISAEASLFKANPSLYVNTGYPGKAYALAFQNYPNRCSIKDNACLAYNFGYNAGKYATNYALTSGVVANNWWLDVEIINSWTTNRQLNTDALEGQVAAIEISAKPNLIGFYTYPTEWRTITDNWKNGLPTWVASDSNYKKVALSYCGKTSFTGAKPTLVQYIQKLDQDFVCN